MNVGLNIANGVRVSIGDKIEKILKNMKDNNVEYTISYNNIQDTDVNMIIFMQKYGVELNIKNDIITFIKSNNTESNFIMKLDKDIRSIDALKIIIANLASQFNVDKWSIRIDKFNGVSLDSTLSIPIKNNYKVKIELVMGANNNVYIHSLELSI